MGCVAGKQKTEDLYVKAAKRRSQTSSSVTGKAGFTDENFTKEEKEIIKTTWKTVNETSEDRQQRGEEIFMKIFAAQPQAKQLFPFRDLHGEDLLCDIIFRGHAARFMNAVDVAVCNLDALDLICGPTLVALGKRHINFEGFMAGYMEVFVASINQVWQERLGKLYNRHARKAWYALFQFLESKMLEGYREALMERQNSTLAAQSVAARGNNVTVRAGSERKHGVSGPAVVSNHVTPSPEGPSFTAGRQDHADQESEVNQDNRPVQASKNITESTRDAPYTHASGQVVSEGQGENCITVDGTDMRAVIQQADMKTHESVPRDSLDNGYY